MRFRSGRFGFSLAAAAFDPDRIIAAIENQSLAGHGSALRIAQFRWSAGATRQHVLTGRAGIDELLSGSAPALHCEHHVAGCLHAVDLRLRAAALRLRAAALGLRAAAPVVPCRRHQQQLHRVGRRSCCADVSDHFAEPAAAHCGSSLRV